MVPLHEAASAGHKDVIQVLLSMNAPVNPRTLADDVPADLARRNGHQDCVKLLREYSWKSFVLSNAASSTIYAYFVSSMSKHFSLNTVFLSFKK